MTSEGRQRFNLLVKCFLQRNIFKEYFKVSNHVSLNYYYLFQPSWELSQLVNAMLDEFRIMYVNCSHFRIVQFYIQLRMILESSTVGNVQFGYIDYHVSIHFKQHLCQNELIFTRHTRFLFVKFKKSLIYIVSGRKKEKFKLCKESLQNKNYPGTFSGNFKASDIY